MTNAHDTADLVPLDEIWNAGPAVREPRGRGKGGVIAFLVVVALVLLGGGGYTTWALTAPLASPDLSLLPQSAPATEPAALAMPTGGATVLSVSGGDAYLGPDAAGVWQSAGGSEPLPIASITKVVTALVVLEAYPLDGPDDAGPVLTFGPATKPLYDKYYTMGSTIAPMPVNSSLTLRDALAAMLIPSASNYAEAIATWAFGSPGSFTSAARDWLARQGLNDTVIVEPTGNDPRNIATPADMLALAKIAAGDPTVSGILAQRSVQLDGPGQLFNTNGLLGRNGVTGLKTGNLGPGTFSLLYTASLDVGIGAPLTVTGATSGAYSRDSLDSAVLTLLDSIRAGFRETTVAGVGRSVGTITTPWGASADVVVAQDASLLVWSDTPISVTLDTWDPSTYTDDEVIGTLTWTAGPATTTADVALAGTIEPPTAFWRLTHPSELGAPTF